MAIDIAVHLRTEIISADSRQCYKEMKIGVARPSDEELNNVPHHFIASHSIHETVTAAGFEEYALEKVNELFKIKDTVVITGGTGLYIKAFCEGLDEIPEIDPSIRASIIKQYEEKGFGWLQDEIRLRDPEFFQKGEIKNPQRIMRALEVIEATGRSVLAFRKGNKAKRPFDIIKIGLELPRPFLRERIDKRVDQMIEDGLPDEVKSLYPYRHLNALQTVGYEELFDFIDGKTGFEKAVELIKTHTRQYAKRQVTWFKKDKEFKWCSPVADEVLEIVKRFHS